MFWVHDKFGNGLHDQMGQADPMTQSCRAGWKLRHARLGRPDNPVKPDQLDVPYRPVRPVKFVDLALPQPDSSRSLPRLGTTSSSSSFDPSRLLGPFMSSGTLDKSMSLGIQWSNSFFFLKNLDFFVMKCFVWIE